MRDPLEDLNAEQRRAAECVRGPVCILAGAGTGKTLTVTRRIANQVACGVVDGSDVLAVTFTDKAAREMGRRLALFGVRGVRVKTFHAEALAQFARLSGTSPEIVPSKGAILAQLAKRLPAPYKFRPVRDLATEIEWAKNRRIKPDRYAGALDGHEPPIPPDLMAGVWRQYERAKERKGLIDFEDLLERALDVLSDPRNAAVVHARYRAFTVDEYQDVNLLQHMLLDVWVGERDDVCVVGDDHQAIFSFTGADPGYLLRFGDRYPDAEVVRLERNYRSTPEILAVANRLAPKLGGAVKTLHATRASGAHPELRRFAAEREEIAFIVAEVRRLHLSESVPYEQMAVLFRINGRSEEFEEAFAAARIPYQVRDGAFLRRPAARAVLARLKRETGPVAEAVERVVRAAGLHDPGTGESDTAEEATRQADLSRLLKLAREFPGESLDAFAADLRARFADEENARGVVLLTYHAAKGLEFDAVFLPRLEEGELPFHLSADGDELAEERRLLYVGITRARRHLSLSWAAARDNGRTKRPRPSRFLVEIAPYAGAAAGGPARRREEPKAPESPVFKALREWRMRVSRDTGKPAYTVFANDTLDRIATVRPETLGELIAISGVGPAKLERYGEEVLAIVKAVSA